MAQMQELKVRLTFVIGAVLSALMFTLSFSGCALEGASTDEVPVVEGQTQRLVIDQGDPDTVFFADVTANGSGCPQGTWTVGFSDQNRVFSLDFSAYEAFVDSTTMRVAVKECTITVSLHTPQGLSFSVETFSFSGTAFLESGVVGQQRAGYFFAGNAVEAARLRSNLRGYFDDVYTFTDRVPLADLVWSRCGTERDLRIPTSLRVLRNNAGGTGYMSTSYVEGEAQLRFRLGWRRC